MSVGDIWRLQVGHSHVLVACSVLNWKTLSLVMMNLHAVTQLLDFFSGIRSQKNMLYTVSLAPNRYYSLAWHHSSQAQVACHCQVFVPFLRCNSAY